MIVVQVPRPTRRSDGIYVPPESVRAKDAQEILTPNEYQKEALRTASGMDQRYPGVLNGVLGLAGESGECADMIKKHFFQGHPLDKEHLAKELGDVAWYLAVTAHYIGYTLEDVMLMNINKLKERYPNGFEAERSLHRQEGDI